MKKIEFICERELTVGAASVRQTVTARIGRPERFRETEYACAFQLSGLKGHSDVQYAHGVDGFQALIMALEGIRATLDKSGKTFSWQGGEQGDHGFPRSIPTFYGLEFTRLPNQLIDRATDKFAARARQQHNKPHE